MPIDAVLFDMDGLLLDTERLSARAFHETTAAFGMADHTALFESLVGCNETTHQLVLSEQLDAAIDPGHFRSEWAGRFHTLVEEDPPGLMPGVLELLDWLQAEGIKRAVATSTGIREAEAKLTRAGIRDRFMSVTGGDQVENGKPHPDIYLAAARSVSANPVDSIGLEDSANGVRASLAAGLHTIQVPNVVQPTPELLQLGHHVCDDLHIVKGQLQTRHIS